MHFVDAHGSAQPVLLATAFDPGFVGPLEFSIVPDDGGVLGGGLKKETVGIGLEHEGAMDVFDLVFVERALADIWNENLPNARRAKRSHRMIAAIPVVECAHDADPLRVGRPHCKAGSSHTIDDTSLRAELDVNASLVA